ncbi:MAG: DUF4142 domain-containing protein [Myxococcota bacterium]
MKIMIGARWLSALAVVCIAVPSGVSAQQESPREEQPTRDQPEVEQAEMPAVAAEEMVDEDSRQALEMLHASNQFEIASARLGEQEAQDRQVKQFAQMLLRDHRQLQRQIDRTAERVNVDLQPVMFEEEEKAAEAEPTGEGRREPGAAAGQEQREAQQPTGQRQQARGQQARGQQASPEEQYSWATEETRKYLGELGEHMKKLRQAEQGQFDTQFVSIQKKAHEKALEEIGDAQDDVESNRVKQLMRTSRPVLQRHLQQAERLEQQMAGTQEGTRTRGTEQREGGAMERAPGTERGRESPRPRR